MTSSQLIAMTETIGPLLKRGQSVYQIARNHPELGVCTKTLYNYIEAGIFKDYGIDNFSLRRQRTDRDPEVAGRSDALLPNGTGAAKYRQ